MASKDLTVVSEKTKFLRRQTRILSENVLPSPRSIETAAKAGIPDTVIRDVTLKLNRGLRRHSKFVYSDMSIRHVADQIDTLYWESAAPDLEVQTDPDGAVGVDDETLFVGDDLSIDKNISKLPVSWDTSEEELPADGDTVEHDDYTSALARLQDLSAKRLTLQQKLSTYRTLLSLLEPYKNPQSTVQPNLVTREAPLAAQLAKTRTLAIRVAGRVGEKYGDSSDLESYGERDQAMLMNEEDGKARLNSILSAW